MFQLRAALAWCLRLHLVEVMSRNPVDNFLRLLKRSPSGAVFNPWWEVDAEDDIARAAPIIRRQQLRAYLQERLGSAKVAVIGEAVGYRGGHFSGIPMTSDRILLGKKREAGIDPEQIFLGINPRR